MSILRLLAGQEEGLTLTEICEALSLPKSSAFDILQTLAHEGYLEISGRRTPAYHLGLEAFRIGSAYLNSVDLNSAAAPILSSLCQEINETVFMSVRSGAHDLVYVLKYLSQSELQTVSTVGTVRGLLEVAMGKAILAALPNAQALEAVTPDMYQSCSVASIRDPASLIDFLDEVRYVGYVVDGTSENSFPVRPVAAPILDANNTVLGAASVVSVSACNSDERLKELGGIIQRTSLQISQRLGYLGDDLYAQAR